MSDPNAKPGVDEDNESLESKPDAVDDAVIEDDDQNETAGEPTDSDES